MRWILTLVTLSILSLGGTFIFGPAIIESNMNKIGPHAPYQIRAETTALHRTLNLADLHSDTLLWDRDILVRGTRGHVDLPRLREGRFAFQVFSVVTKAPPNLNYDRNPSDKDQLTLLVQTQLWPIATWNSLLERALFQARKLDAAAARAPKELHVIRSVADLDAVMTARASGSSIVGGLLATEGAHPFEGKLENVKRLYDAGYRMIGLQHFFDNELGGSMHGMEKGGLTEFGQAAVKEIERLGMIVDLAHSSAAVYRDVLAMATKPVVVSHTGVQGTCQTARNLSDDQLKAVAANGGLIGIGYWEGAACDITPKGVAKAIRYAVTVAGIDHVALGSDYDGSTTVVFDASESAALIEALIDEGFTAEEIAKVAGENQIRFFRAALPTLPAQ